MRLHVCFCRGVGLGLVLTRTVAGRRRHYSLAECHWRARKQNTTCVRTNKHAPYNAAARTDIFTSPQPVAPLHTVSSALFLSFAAADAIAVLLFTLFQLRCLLLAVGRRDLTCLS